MSIDRKSSQSNADSLALDQSGTSLQVFAPEGPSRALSELSAATPRLEYVECLKLKHCRLRPRDMELLGRVLQRLPNLSYLDIGDNELRSEGFGELGRYAAFLRRLKTLSVHRNGIGPMGLSSFLRTAEHLESLEYLDLAHNPLGDEGAQLLASSAEKFRVLNQLAIYECGIGDAGVEALACAVRRPVWRNSLKQIGFRGNPVAHYEYLCETPETEYWRDDSIVSMRMARPSMNDVANPVTEPATAEGTEFVMSLSVQKRPVVTETTIPVRRQWIEITSAVLGMFGPEGAKQFSDRLRHRGFKSKTLRAMHEIMEARSFRVRAYSPKAAGETQENGEGTKQHAYAFHAAFRRALADPQVMVALFRHLVLEAGGSSEVPQGIDDLVFCCLQCGALHYPEDESGTGPRRPTSCSACGKRGLAPEGLPARWEWCKHCEIDFKASHDAVWRDVSRRVGKCPRCSGLLNVAGAGH